MPGALPGAPFGHRIAHSRFSLCTEHSPLPSAPRAFFSASSRFGAFGTFASSGTVTPGFFQVLPSKDGLSASLAFYVLLPHSPLSPLRNTVAAVW